MVLALLLWQGWQGGVLSLARSRGLRVLKAVLQSGGQGAQQKRAKARQGQAGGGGSRRAAAHVKRRARLENVARRAEAARQVEMGLAPHGGAGPWPAAAAAR